MIGELANDLFEKLNAIPQLAGRVGLAVGGHKADPGLSTAPLPLAWVLFEDMKANDERLAGMATRQSMLLYFRVFLIAEYQDQSGLVSTLYPLLETALQETRGSTAPNGATWRFESLKLTQINPDRLFHELRLSIAGHL